MKRVVLVEEEDIHIYPPLITVLRVLLLLGHEVTLISRGGDSLPQDVLGNPNYHFVPVIAHENRTTQISKLLSRWRVSRELSRKTEIEMKKADILWTGTVQTVRDMRRIICRYKNVLHLLELSQFGYTTRYTKFPLKEIAQNSWKVVVAEENRAYIEKAWWDLKEIPYILPNKPFSIEYGVITDEMKNALLRMEKEEKKIVLYLGGIYADREFDVIASAIKKRKDYALYIVGKAYNKVLEKKFKQLIREYDVRYLGHYDAPSHLAFVQYAHIGILPYKVVDSRILSKLNALYCAPNKIFEYAGYGIPMIGTNVLGLKRPFEKYNIGVCWDEKNEESFYKAMDIVEMNYSEMSRNCKTFYEGTNIIETIKAIVEG